MNQEQKEYKHTDQRLDEHDEQLALLLERVGVLDQRVQFVQEETKDNCELCKAEFEGKAKMTRDYRG